MLIFQIKRVISSKKWCKYVVTFFFYMLKIWVGRTTVSGEKKRGWPNLRLSGLLRGFLNKTFLQLVYLKGQLDF